MFRSAVPLASSMRQGPLPILTAAYPRLDSFEKSEVLTPQPIDSSAD